MAGDVDPFCRRAQDAHRMATRYPLWLAQGDVPPRIAGVGAPQRPPPGSRGAVEPPSLDPHTAERQAVLHTVFGSAAPHAQRAIDAFNTPTGQRAAGVSAVALVALLAAKAAQ